MNPGAICGTVYDSSGSPVAGVRVALIDLNHNGAINFYGPKSGLLRNTPPSYTNSSGEYFVNFLWDPTNPLVAFGAKYRLSVLNPANNAYQKVHGHLNARVNVVRLVAVALQSAVGKGVINGGRYAKNLKNYWKGVRHKNWAKPARGQTTLRAVQATHRSTSSSLNSATVIMAVDIQDVYL